MIEFNPMYLLFVMFLGFFIPGIIFSLGLLKRKDLPLFEKAAIGMGIGMVVPALISFLLFLVGVDFLYGTALISVGAFYVIAVALFVKEKAWEGLSIPADPKLMAASAALALLMILTFWIRIQTYSPIYMELDPYYYMYATHQIIVHGGAPLSDGTAWYPMEVNHRTVPLKVYPEAIAYTMYTHGGEFEKYLLSDLAGSFPPVLAALAVFFFALFISAEYKREFGIIAAAVFSLAPMYLMKTLAGESEIQPYAFFALAFFFAMYALAIKRKDRLFAGLAALAFMATMMGSSSYVVIFAALIIFIPLQATLLFFMKEDLKEFVILNAMVAVGPIAAAILLGTYGAGAFSAAGLLSGTILGLLSVIVFALAVQQIRKSSLDEESAAYALGGLVVVGLLAIAFTPVGTAITSLAGGSLSIAKFTLPLHKTIAEQGVAGASFEDSLGFMAMDLDGIPALIFAIPAFIVNGILQIAIGVLNGMFASGLEFSEKSNSMLLGIFFFAMVAIGHSLYRKITFKDLRLPLLFMALIFPISVVGMLKTKYTIYLAFATAVALGVVLGEAFDVADLLGKRRKEEGQEEVPYGKYAYMALLAIGLFFIICQATIVGFNDDGTAKPALGKPLLATSFQERFQDDPLGVQPKLRSVCAMFDPMGTSQDPVCVAARDPKGFADRGINYQYEPNICAISMMSNPSLMLTDQSAIPMDERISMQYRCLMRIDDYWVDTMEWMESGTPENARFTSWWDYGHWTNYFGQRNTVLRNEHSSHEMILEVAHGFLYGTPEELKAFMLEHDSRYVFFDKEIIGSMKSDGTMMFGGKYGALNYLACSRNNETSVEQNPGDSYCEFEHLWEQVLVPTGLQAQECVISPLSGKKGVVGYTMKWTAAGKQATPTYCVGPVTLADGANATGTYYLDRKYESGELKLNKATLSFDYSDESGVYVFTNLYDKYPRWVENGELKSGWEDRKGKFYDSVLYNAFILRDLPGFELVYETPNGEVKMYKIKE